MEMAKARRRSGLLRDQADILKAMERGETPQYIPVRFKDGTYQGDALASAAQLGALCRHMDATLQDLAAELRGGSVAADPWFRSQTDTACRNCDYAAACHFDARDDQVRYISSLRPAQVWEALTEEEAQP